MSNHGKMNLFFVIGSNHFHDQSNRQGIIQILRKKGFSITEVKQSISCNHSTASSKKKDNPCNFQPYPATDVEKDSQEEELLGSSNKSYESERNEIVNNNNEDNSEEKEPYSATYVEKDSQEEELLGSSKKSYESERNETVHNNNEDNSGEKDNPCNFQPYSATDVEKDSQEEELLGSSKKSYESEENSHFQPNPSTDLTWVIPAILSAFIFGFLTIFLTSCICRRAHTRGEPR